MIGVSACLAGCPCRYDGGSNTVERLKQLVADGKAIMFCPEVLGGLTTPREPAEIVGGCADDVWNGTATVQTISGADVTEAFKKGALLALEEVKKHQIKTVILKANSPSCGSSMVYDGTFTGRKVIGKGVTSALFKKHGIKVMDETQCDAFLDQLLAVHS